LGKQQVRSITSNEAVLFLQSHSNFTDKGEIKSEIPQDLLLTNILAEISAMSTSSFENITK
jgi:hypothetical protein